MYIKQLLPGEYNHCEANLNKVRVWNKSDENFKRTGQREQHQDSWKYVKILIFSILLGWK